MAGNARIEEQLKLQTPNTYKALTYLVPALADTTSSLGKKSLFGRDKGAAAFEKMLDTLQRTISAMYIDGLISRASTPPNTLDTLLKFLSLFSEAHPNWQDAYSFAGFFFQEERDTALATIAKMRP
ncbi:hypothetical protein A7D27_10025 [Pseudomonas sp. 1D4]|uniref:hypothetical protein n=1 Tax=Pseudomonas sp. 1D4 TaxID=1843691 RepID=UPI00084A3F90|nr:hypothetical protein [Pseudomonas sp. 1D4]OEC43147.1 hypothetical protein A7D27_10025 [Pseudomonas sp. 1D4]